MLLPAIQNWIVRVPVMKALQDSGVDMIELGMPYSDPLADGPVIQASSTQALANGMTIATLFEQLRDFRKQVYVPVILMGYMNPVLQYGFEKFCQHAAMRPSTDLFYPTCPNMNLKRIWSYYAAVRVEFIFLVTPETSEERIRKLDSLSTGFLYAVSSSTTGKDKDMNAVEHYL